MSYLELAKRAEARLRASLGIERPYEIDEIDEVSPGSPRPGPSTDIQPRQDGPVAPCVLCDIPTTVRYGDLELCLPCGTATTVSRRLALRAVLRECFALLAVGPHAVLADCRSAVQRLTALWDDVGPGQATIITDVAERQWNRETGICPKCGERGPVHREERGPETPPEAAR